MIGKLATAAALGLLTVGGLAVAQDVVPRTGDTGRCGATGDAGKFAGGTAVASRNAVMRGDCEEVIAEPVVATAEPTPVAQPEPAWSEPAVTTGASAPDPVVEPVDATTTTYERTGERG